MGKTTHDTNAFLEFKLCIHSTQGRLLFIHAVCTLDYALYSAPNIIRVIKSRRLRWAGHIACMGEKRGAYRVLVGKPDGTRPLGRPRRRWEDNIEINFRQGEWGHGLDRSGSG
jgi:hypothetical protein